MNLDGVRDFYRGIINPLGFTEWDDGFNKSNIPSTILDRSYCFQIGRIVSGPANQLHHTFRYPLTLRVHLKGFRNTNAAIDEALTEAHNIIAGLLSPSNRLQTIGLKDIRPVTIDVQQLSDSNDNAVIVEMEFDNYLVFKF